MSPINELQGRVVEQVKNIMGIIRSPCFLFKAFLYSIVDIFDWR